MTARNATDDFPKAMLADLRKSDLDAKDAAALGLRFCSTDGQPGYAIPYADLDRKQTDHYRIRFLGEAAALPKDAKGKPKRYTQPKASAPRFYYAHFAGGVNWSKVAADPKATIYLTEGEKKAACATKFGLPTIGLGGVWNWRTKEDGGRAIDDFNRITWTGRKVVIVFDSDASFNTSVQAARVALAGELIKRGAVPYYVDPPPAKGGAKTGLDDFLVRHGPKARKAFGALREHSMLVPGGLSFADLAAKALPAQRWAVEGLIPVGLTMLNGKPKIGKSFLALDLAIAVASGGKVLGSYAAKPGGVLHLALEDTARRFQDRLKRVLDGAPAPAEAMFFNEWRRVEDHGLDALRRAIEARPDTRLVIIDTFAKMRTAPTGRGNLYGEDYLAIAELKKIADDYSISVVVVHHTRKAESNDQLDSVSGSTGLTGAADTILVLRRERIEADAVLFITGRDVQEQEIALRIDPRTMRWEALGEASEYRMSEQRHAILTALEMLGKPSTPKEVAEAVPEMSRVAVRVRLRKMLGDGQLQLDMAGKYTLVPTTPNRKVTGFIGNRHIRHIKGSGSSVTSDTPNPSKRPPGRKAGAV